MNVPPSIATHNTTVKWNVVRTLAKSVRPHSGIQVVSGEGSVGDCCIIGTGNREP